MLKACKYLKLKLLLLTKLGHGNLAIRYASVDIECWCSQTEPSWWNNLLAAITRVWHPQNGAASIYSRMVICDGIFEFIIETVKQWENIFWNENRIGYDQATLVKIGNCLMKNIIEF